MKGINYQRPQSFKLLEVKTCSNDLHACKEHIHQELSLGYIEKGASNLNVKGKNYYIKEQEAVIIYPFISHQCQPVDITNWQYTMIYIERDFCRGIINNLAQEHPIGIKKLGGHEFKRIRNLSEILKGNENCFYKETELISTLLEIFASCDIDIKLETDQKMEQIKEYIEECFLDVIQLKELEDKFNINKFTLIRSFKRKFNTTPNAYQLQLKVNYGKQLLKTNNNIVDIAQQAGFYDQAHFSKEFKKAYGISPLQYYRAVN